MHYSQKSSIGGKQIPLWNLCGSNLLNTKNIVFIACLLFLSIKVQAINPSRKYQWTPEDLGLKYQKLKINVNNAVQLNSWIFVHELKKRPFVIVSNGDAGNMANALGQAKSLYDAGYNVVLYDYRGFGESSDFEMNRDMMYYDEFYDDLKATISFVKKKYKTNTVVLYGISMGTIISSMVLQRDQSIKAAIFDSFALDPTLIVKRIKEKKNKTVLLPKGAYEYVERNKTKCKIPVLLFSGLKDIFTQATDYKDFLALNPGSKLVTWNCDHIQCYYEMTKDLTGDLYILEIKNYLDGLNL